MCCVLSIGNGPRRNRPPTVAASQFPLSQYYCYWVPATKSLCCTIHQSSVLRLPQVLRQSSLLRLLRVHHSPIFSVAPIFTVAPFVCTIHQFSVLHQSSLLLHLLATSSFSESCDLQPSPHCSVQYVELRGYCPL